MVFLVTLQYPNGRTHEAVLDRDQAPKPGRRSQMYGHTWRVAPGLSTAGRAIVRRPRVDMAARASTRYACVCVD